MIVVYERLYDEIAFTPPSLREARVKRPKNFVRLVDAEIVEPKEDFMDERYLLLAHSREYIEILKRLENVERPTALYELGLPDPDTYAYPGFFTHILHYVAGTLTAVEEALRKGIAFNTQGGLHHAHRSRSSGFCPVNDVAIAALYAHSQGYRVAIVDYDGHHGDGTQEILYDKKILHISVHDYGIFPGTGRYDELGAGEGLGYNVNIPLAHYSADDSARLAAELIRDLLERYNPDIVIVQSGVDGRHADPLTTLRYSVHAYIAFAKALRGYKLAFTAGGGYTDEVPRLRKAIVETAEGKEVEAFEEPKEDYELETNKERIEALRRKLKELKML